jgi:hypothetical protein
MKQNFTNCACKATTRRQKMTTEKFIKTLPIFFITSLCFAQTDSINQQPFYFFSHSFSIYNYKLIPYNNKIDKLFPKENYADIFFHKPIYYDSFLRRNFYFNYTANPWSASTPLDAITSGSLNYLMQALDKKYFYNKRPIR